MYMFGINSDPVGNSQTSWKNICTQNVNILITLSSYCYILSGWVQMPIGFGPLSVRTLHMLPHPYLPSVGMYRPPPLFRINRKRQHCISTLILPPVYSLHIYRPIDLIVHYLPLNMIRKNYFLTLETNKRISIELSFSILALFILSSPIL